MGLPIKDLRKHYTKFSHLKSLILLPLCEDPFLPSCVDVFFPDSTRFEPFSIPQLSTVIIKSEGCTLYSQESPNIFESNIPG